MTCAMLVTLSAACSRARNQWIGPRIKLGDYVPISIPDGNAMGREEHLGLSRAVAWRSAF
jgi:hypothetical protein